MPFPSTSPPGYNQEMKWPPQKLENLPGYREAMAKVSLFVVLALVISALIDVVNSHWDRLSLDVAAALAFSIVGWRSYCDSKKPAIIREASLPVPSVKPDQNRS
jgi:hypothetical protein